MGELLLFKLLSFQRKDHYFSLSARMFCWLFSSTMGFYCYTCWLSFLGKELGLCWWVSCHYRLP